MLINAVFRPTQISLAGKGLIDTRIHEGVLYNYATPYLRAIRHDLYRAGESNSARYTSEARLQRPGVSRSGMALTIG